MTFSVQFSSTIYVVYKNTPDEDSQTQTVQKLVSSKHKILTPVSHCRQRLLTETSMKNQYSRYAQNYQIIVRIYLGEKYQYNSSDTFSNLLCFSDLLLYFYCYSFSTFFSFYLLVSQATSSNQKTPSNQSDSHLHRQSEPMSSNYNNPIFSLDILPFYFQSLPPNNYRQTQLSHPTSHKYHSNNQ